MCKVSKAMRHVIARKNNVVCVDFTRRPDPPAPRFPGAAGLRIARDVAAAIVDVVSNDVRILRQPA